MANDNDEFLKQIVAREVADDEMAVYPATRFELETIDESRVLLKVHFFASPDDHDNNKISTLNFVVPAVDVAGLNNLLTLVLKELKEDSKKRVH